MTTTELTDYTRDTLAHVGVTLRRNNVGLKGRYRYGIKDWPDLIGYDRMGRFWGIEIKNAATKDKDRGKQAEARAAMTDCNCIVIVVTSEADIRKLMQLARSADALSHLVSMYPEPHT